MEPSPRPLIPALPTFLADAVYAIISRNRTRWFRRLEACRVPDAAPRRRFLP